MSPVEPSDLPLWPRFQAFFQVLFLCRFSVAMVAVGTLALGFTEQSREAVCVLFDPPRAAGVLFLYVASVLWAHGAWYFARVLLQFRYPGNIVFTPDRPGWSWYFKSAVYLPRALALVPLVATGLIALASTHWHNRAALYFVAAELVTVVLFCFFFPRRRRWMKRLHLGRPEDDALPYSPKRASLTEVPRLTLIWIGAQAALFLALFLLFALCAVPAAQLLGAPAILLIACATWICAGSLLTYLASWSQFPALLALVLWSSICSHWNDNHAVRWSANESIARPPSVEVDFNRWREQTIGRGAHARWIFIATEGGGIRAAYWTAAVLGKLDDGISGFRKHLYGISSVSGGSLGAGVYLALAVDGGSDVRARAADALSADALSPPLAKGLFCDLLQRLWPWPHDSLDRGAALEGAWTRAMPPKNRELEQTFGALWIEHPEAPRLFLNAASVETGQRAIISFANLDADSDPDAPADSWDVWSRWHALSFVQAIHASARFTLISPAGLMESPSHERRGHIVDGGYFEDSGAATALDLVQPLVEKRGAPPPLVIVIRYQGEREDPKPLGFATELLAPVSAMLQAREARGSLALATLIRWAKAQDTRWPAVDARGRPQTHLVELVLCPEKNVHLSLGWLLSREAREAIDRGLSTPDNQDALAAVAAWIAP